MISRISRAWVNDYCSTSSKLQLIFQNIATWTWVFLKLSSEPLLFIYFSWLNDNPWMMSKRFLIIIPNFFPAKFTPFSSHTSTMLKIWMSWFSHSIVFVQFTDGRRIWGYVYFMIFFKNIFNRQLSNIQWWTKRYIPIIVVAHMALLGVQFFLQLVLFIFNAF